MVDNDLQHTGVLKLCALAPRQYTAATSSCFLSVRRVRKVKLVAVGVHYDHEPVTPVPIFHVHAPSSQLRAQGIQHFDIERDEYEALAHLVGPLRGENERAALPLDLSDPSLPLFLITPWMAEPEPLHVEIDRSVDVRHEQHRPRKPLVAHDVTLQGGRSEERRVGKEWRCRWWP